MAWAIEAQRAAKASETRMNAIAPAAAEPKADDEQNDLLRERIARLQARSEAETAAAASALGMTTGEYLDHLRASKESEARRAVIDRDTERAQRSWEASNTPARYRVSDLRLIGDDMPLAYRRAAEILGNLIAEPGTTALIGPPGVGKTDLACALIREFCRRGETALYATASDIFAEIKSSWGARQKGDRTESAIWAGLRGVHLLVIDEAQLRAESAWEQAQMSALIDGRYAALRATVLLSNLDDAALIASLSPAAASRIRETGKILTCGWPSFRTSGTARKADLRWRDTYPPIGGIGE